MKLDRKDWLALAGFLMLVLFFFFRFLNGEQLFAFKDLSRYFYPLRFLMVEQVKFGRLPLWNPYIFCGYPLLATLQVGFFYPLTVIYYLLPFNLAFNYYIILHYLLAACFMYFLLRHYELSQNASFLGGMIFAFSGYLLSVSNMNTSLSSMIWLPLVLLFFDRLVSSCVDQTGSPTYAKDVAILGILLALQFLGGEPTIIYITLFFLMAYAVIFSGSRKAFFKDIRGLIFSGIIALGLIAVQLFPFLELVRLSTRVVKNSYDLVTLCSFPPREIITFIFPYFFGIPAKIGGYTEVLLGDVSQHWLISPYIGILPLSFVLLSFRKNKRLSLFMFGAALVALLLAFGRYTPFYRVAFLIPGISMIRYPVKYLFLTTFCLSFLAAFGFERLLNVLGEQKEGLKINLIFYLTIILILAAIFILIYIFRLQLFYNLAQRYPQNLPGHFFNLLARIIEFNLVSFINIVFYLFCFTLVLWVAWLGKIKKGFFGLLIIILVMADLFAAGFPIAVSASAKVFSAIPENYKILMKDENLYRFFYTPELEEENRLISGEDYSAALLNAKDNLASNRHIPSHLYDFFGYASIRPQGLSSYYYKSFDDKNIEKNINYLSLYNVKYIASVNELRVPYLRLLRHKQKYGRGLYLYENTRVLPRAYVLDLEGKPDLKNAQASIEKYLSNEIGVFVKLEENGALFISESYYPGWKVFVDGKEEKIELAHDLFRVVKLAAGKHRVRFVYDPLSFKIGGGISLLTLLGLFLGGVIQFYKRKH